MLVRIEKGSAVPVSRQIADQIRAQCLSGRLTPGTQVPSVRQMARDLAVNQNTVLRVYERLANENLLEVRHGEGQLQRGDPGRQRVPEHRHSPDETVSQRTASDADSP